MNQYIYEWDHQTDFVKEKFLIISNQTLLDKNTLFYYVTKDDIPSYIHINHIIKNELICMIKHLKKTYLV
jgi:hypothetical protein